MPAPSSSAALSVRLSTPTLEALLEPGAEKLINKAMAMALKGDTAALRLCLERILPACLDRLIELDLPPVNDPAQTSTSLAAIGTAIGAGQITPSEGGTLSRILSAQASVLATEQLEHWKSSNAGRVAIRGMTRTRRASKWCRLGATRQVRRPGPQRQKNPGRCRDRHRRKLQS